MKLSLCIPTYNEEKNLHIALDSAYDIADEVVIIDGGSTDKTVDIAKSYGKKVIVYHVDNPPNFLINKQRAIEKAKGEWILQLDADEAITPELKKELVRLLENPDKDGYWIPRKNFFLGRFLMKGGVYPDSVLRLYKKEKAHFELKNVHEHAQVEGEIGTTNHAMEHWADPTFERYIERWNRYTTFDAMQAYEKKEELCGKCHFIGKPLLTFLMIYIRHKGFQDGFPGFVWALFSSIRYWAIYIKWRQLRKKTS